VNPDGPFEARMVTTKVVITAKPEPEFTEEARKHNVEGIVRLRAILSSSGQVRNISILKRLPDGLTEKAIAAAHRSKFRPARTKARPSASNI